MPSPTAGAPIGTTTTSFTGQPVYAPRNAPLTPGMPWLKAGVSTKHGISWIRRAVIDDIEVDPVDAWEQSQPVGGELDDRDR